MILMVIVLSNDVALGHRFHILAEHHGAILAQSIQLSSQKSKGGYRGRGYPTTYQLTKSVRKKDNIWICLTSPESNILLLQIMEMM